MWSSYAFGLFSSTLKDELSFSQGTVDIIASMGELGLWSSFIVGVLLERFSPRQVYVLGSGFTLVGLGYVALATGEVVATSPASFGLMFFVANFGTACFGQSAQAISMRNFPAADRGKVSGIIKCVFGLSSAVLGVLYLGLLGGNDASKFLGFLSIGVPLAGLMTTIPLNVVPQKHVSYALERCQGVSASMLPFYSWFSMVATALTVAIVMEAVGISLPTPWSGIALILIVGSSMLLPLQYGRVFFRSRAGGVSISSGGLCNIDGEVGLLEETHGDFELGEEGQGEQAYLLAPSMEEAQDDETDSCRNNKDLTWRQCLRDLRFWVLFLAFMCGTGAGLVVINNIASLAESLGLESSTFLVTMLGLANAFGRLSVGWFSDRVVGMGLPRSLVLCATLLCTCVVSFLLAAGFADLLYVLCVASGICYGAMFALVLALTGDLFGVTHIGTNYGLLDLGPAAGSFFFATGVVNIFYRQEGDGSDCTGPSCFRGTFFCTGSSCLLACVLVYTAVTGPGMRTRHMRVSRDV
ncbi:unnamed protein product [Discosporangium mesarthrocarpum]